MSPLIKSYKFLRVKQYIWDICVNSFLSSFIVPISIRMFVLKFFGCEIGKKSTIQGNGYLGSKNLKIGNNSYINRSFFIDNGTGGKVIIGDNCSIGYKVTFVTTDHDYSNPNKRGGVVNFKNIIIEDGVWIGANATILPGVTIRKGCIIAAGTLVKNDTNPHIIYGGVPAKEIKFIE